MKTFTDKTLETLQHVREQRDQCYTLNRTLYAQICEQNAILLRVCKRHQFTADELMWAANIFEKSKEVIAQADGRKPILKAMKERTP